jgi:nickel-dependent lactate racemase
MLQPPILVMSGDRQPPPVTIQWPLATDRTFEPAGSASTQRGKERMGAHADSWRRQGGPLRVPWGASATLDLNLPDEWKVIGVLDPKPVPPAAAPEAAIAEAISAPIGCPPLREMARGAKSAAIVVDDTSRPTPAHLMLPHVMTELLAAGVPAQGIKLVTALGTHRPMSPSDMAAKVGARWSETLAWENHDSTDPARNVYLGMTRRRTPVYVNATVADADIVVLLGTIEPHVIASFGGGYKNLIPGVAGARTISATHTLNLTNSTYDMAGTPPDQNPMRIDLEEGSQMLRKPVFIVNSVLDASLQLVRAVAGHPIAAHREGAVTSAEICGVPVPSAADIVIAASFPMDLDFRQGLKALANSIRAVRPGGLMINLIRAEEGVGHMQDGRKRPPGLRTLKLLAPLLLKAIPRRTSGESGEEFKFFQYFALQTIRRHSVLVYAPNVPREFATAFPVAHFCWSLDALWRAAQKRLPGKADVLIAPAGGVTFPILARSAPQTA